MTRYKGDVRLPSKRSMSVEADNEGEARRLLVAELLRWLKEEEPWTMSVREL